MRPLGLCCAAVLGAWWAKEAPAQSTATCAVACRIVTPLALRYDGPLVFGSLSASPTSDGTVTISALGERSASGAVALQGGAWTAARLTVVGEEGADYVISLPAHCTIRRVGGPEAMLVDGFSSSPAGRGKLLGGCQAISVGATLHVNAAQPVGIYEGTFEVTVMYQ